MSVDLYYIPPSSPSRAVQMLAETIGLQLNLHIVDLRAGEQHRPEFLRMNPAHAVPTIDDNGFYLSESRAILTYLVDKYAAGSALYPAQPDRRALIQQRMQFELNVVYRAFIEYYYLQLFFGADADAAKFERIAVALSSLDGILGRSVYVAGDVYTVADISLLATISSFCHEDGVELVESRWPNVCRWYERARAETKGWHWNEEGLVVYRSFFAALRAKRAAAAAEAAVVAEPEKVEPVAEAEAVAEPQAVVAAAAEIEVVVAETERLSVEDSQTDAAVVAAVAEVAEVEQVAQVTAASTVEVDVAEADAEAVAANSEEEVKKAE